MIFYASNKSSIFCNKNIDFYLTDRFGGVSKPPFSSFNLGENTNDSNVYKNKAILKKFLQTETIFYLNQVHSDKIIPLNNNIDELLGDGDGIICDKKNQFAMISVADCNPIILYDWDRFAILHAGRVGLERNIITKATTLLNTKNIYAFVGVGIKKCCYEINGKLLESYKKHNAKYLHLRDNKYYLDMEMIIKDEFLQNGIRDFEIMPQCSCCNDSFYSYRRQKECGRFALIARLK
ncbi:hypothetical protein CCY99_08310 [Helicobacter sp. 16-1353]|uniref:polyphenol oxidase family protein n=1 Tax=Helicobacter sp. 16-1353 TaxID=2004996 RepID=UPI000DCC2E9E|nr:polyphenol oxidase family protein [Helicobacter sp. 16-1353]RAX51793.1 hypothetical protein CCY99_08310 [Helicobacter sp. 16-1353]